MNETLVNDVANAVLYEGYILYPYRPSALKNRHRFNFGVVSPAIERSSSPSGEASSLETQCLVRGRSEAVLRVTVRFLQLVARRVGHLNPSSSRNAADVRPADLSLVDELSVDGHVYRSWQEAVERDITITSPLGTLTDHPMREQGEWSCDEQVEILRSAESPAVGAIVRRQETLCAEVRLFGDSVGGGLFRLTLCVANITQPPALSDRSRDAWLMHSLVSTHAIVRISGGECLSVIDPPADAYAAAASCRQRGLWPVLVGEPQDRDALLASPIILYDYPQIAPESAGDFCDGTEMDEMLALRVLTMTDAEKREMREGDERGRLMLERTERLSPDDLAKLHGVLRGLHAVDHGGPQ